MVNQTLPLPSWGPYPTRDRLLDSPPVLLQVCAGCWGNTFEKLLTLSISIGKYLVRLLAVDSN